MSNDPTLDMVDARIAAAREQTTHAGTLTERTSATRALVTFDGSSVAVPVKMGSTALAEAGDRVVLMKVGTDWVVISSFTTVTLGQWIDYSTTFAFTGVGSAPTKGTSVYVAEYMWVNRSLIRMRVRISLLSGFVQGTGAVAVGLPPGIPAAANSVNADVGQWWLEDSGVAYRTGVSVSLNTTFLILYADGGGASINFGGTPFDVPDVFRLSHEYEPA